MMTGAEIRSAFIEFFRQRGHEVVPSASLLPEKDPTLLFTNAGMVQFKNVFLGTEKRASRRAVNSQKCLRLSGKHNDLEEVGRDTYHHTFFEMLGNWSFGDYYKREAIALGLGAAHQGMEAAQRQAVRDRVSRPTTRPRNAGAQRPTSPATTSCASARRTTSGRWARPARAGRARRSTSTAARRPATCGRCRATSVRVNAGCARFIELWNLVFIQYNRTPDGTLEPLAERHVDTGAGLERLAAVLQGVKSNYDTDLLRDLIRFTEEHAGKRYGADDKDDLSFRVIADHARALTFMIADGALPSNDGRGYVLRRVLRRAARHAKQLGFDEPFLWRVTGAVVADHGSGISGDRRAPGAHRAGDPQRGRALCRDPRQGARRCSRRKRRRCAPAAPRCCPATAAFQLVRHLRFPARHDPGHPARR